MRYFALFIDLPLDILDDFLELMIKFLKRDLLNCGDLGGSW
jgi:hypothetical protein